MKLIAPTFFLQLLPSLIHCNSQANPTATESFIESLTLSKFSQCTLLFFQDRFDNSDSISRIVEATQLNYFNIKYAFPLQSDIAAFLDTMKQMLVPETNISSSVGSRLPLTFPVKVSNYRKKSDQCLLAILFLTDTRPEFIKQIYNLITPAYIPITRKDEDHYIFVTRPKQMEKLLLMRELPARIKFRLMVGERGNEVGEKILISTIYYLEFDMTQIIQVSKTLTFSLKACFFCGPGGQPEIIEFTKDAGSVYHEDIDFFPDFVWNLNGRLLQIACPYIRAKIEVDPPYEGVNNARRGIWKWVLEDYLMVKFNFSYRMFAATDINSTMGGGGTGLLLPNGTWTGVTGDLIAGRADLGVETANTPKRILYIDFTTSFYDFDYLTFVTSEGSRVFSPLAILWPFDLLMWICIIFCTVGAFLFFFIIIKIIMLVGLGEYSLHFARRGQSCRQVWTFKYQVQFIITSFVDQDCVLPVFTPLRCFVAVWLFATLVLTTVYRTKLVSFMAFPVKETLPQTFDELAYSDYKVGFMKHGDSAFNTLAASTEPVYVKLVNEMEIIRTYGLECLIKVTKQRYGCIAYESAIRHQTERNLTGEEARKLVVSSAHTYNVVFGISTEGKSIFRLNFGKYLSYARPSHLQSIWEAMDFKNVRRLKKEWWRSINKTETEKTQDVVRGADENLTLQHISGAFFILFMFLGLGGIIFSLEVTNYHKHYLKKKCSEVSFAVVVVNKLLSDRLVKTTRKVTKMDADGEK